MEATEEVMGVSPFIVPVVLFICIAASVIGVPIARAFARRVERAPLQPSVPPDVVARLERMEQALDSIAIEVERISEGQRFTTKLLSERADRGLPAPGAAPSPT
jgi:DNA-binding transcriptional regulator YdaS (Cro superfamily)